MNKLFKTLGKEFPIYYKIYLDREAEHSIKRVTSFKTVLTINQYIALIIGLTNFSG